MGEPRIVTDAEAEKMGHGLTVQDFDRLLYTRKLLLEALEKVHREPDGTRIYFPANPDCPTCHLISQCRGESDA